MDEKDLVEGMVKCMNLLQEMGQLKVCLIPIIRDMYGSCTAMR